MTQPSKAIRQTILVVEDDPAILKMVKLTFEEAGFGVLSAGSANHARLIAEGFSHPIHLLLSDVMMPDVSGPELANTLKQNRPEMPVLLMSGFADGAMLVLNHGCHFIAGPFLASALLARVNERVAQRHARARYRPFRYATAAPTRRFYGRERICARRARGVG